MRLTLNPGASGVHARAVCGTAPKRSSLAPCAGPAGKMCDDLDPKGLIRESYRIAGIGEPECRAIFLDWAIALPEGRARAVNPSGFLLIASLLCSKPSARRDGFSSCPSRRPSRLPAAPRTIPWTAPHDTRRYRMVDRACLPSLRPSVRLQVSPVERTLPVPPERAAPSVPPRLVGLVAAVLAAAPPQGRHASQLAIRRSPAAWLFSGWNWVSTIVPRATIAVTSPP